MSVPTWFVFGCNIDMGPEGDDPPQTSWNGKYQYAFTCEEALSRARKMVLTLDCELAVIMYYVDGKVLELYGTFGFRPPKNDYDLPGSRADGYVLVRKFCEAVLSNAEPTHIKE